MIIPDTNLLIYAENSDSAHHDVARYWLEKTLSGDAQVGLIWQVIIGFIRITTHPKILESPIRYERALDIVTGWLQQPFAEIVLPGNKHWLILDRLLRASGTAGNLTNDAHIAATAIENSGVVYSADNDFKRFAGLNHVNPLDAGAVHEPIS